MSHPISWAFFVLGFFPTTRSFVCLCLWWWSGEELVVCVFLFCVCLLPPVCVSFFCWGLFLRRFVCFLPRFVFVLFARARIAFVWWCFNQGFVSWLCYRGCVCLVLTLTFRVSGSHRLPNPSRLGCCVCVVCLFVPAGKKTQQTQVCLCRLCFVFVCVIVSIWEPWRA